MLGVFVGNFSIISNYQFPVLFPFILCRQLISAADRLDMVSLVQFSDVVIVVI